MLRIINKCVVLFALCLLVPAVGGAEERSPADIVRLFNQCYGTARMDEVAEYTTSRFRDEKPKSVWISDTWKALRRIAYKRSQGAILGSKIAQNNAAIAMETRIETTAGETAQKEIFYLIKTGNRWFIDGLEIADEEVEGALDHSDM